MHIVKLSELPSELAKIGAEPMGLSIMEDKATFHAIKIKDIAPTPANIIKQEMLSAGGDAATASGAINHSIPSTDIIIFGSKRQFKQLIAKLRMNKFSLPSIAEQLEQVINNYEKKHLPLSVGNTTLDLGHRTYIMGILNATPDSFSDGGKFIKLEDAIIQVKKMIEDGADIIDVGGESTRPGAKEISADEEKKRVLPIIERLVRETNIKISIDTRKSQVAKSALELGAHMVNDISALRHDKKMAEVCAQFNVPVVLMHMQGTPQSMQENPHYADLISDIISYLTESVNIAKNAGILADKIIVDPGIGFGKTVEHNLEIFKRLRDFKSLGFPILIGPSRKAVIGKVLDLPVEERLEGTAALVALAILNGADIIRVHDVKEMSRVAKMTDAIIRKR